MTQPEPIIGGDPVATAPLPEAAPAATPVAVTELGPGQLLEMLIADGGEPTYLFYLAQALTALRNGGPSPDAPNGE